MEIFPLKKCGLKFDVLDIGLYQSPKPSSQHPFITCSLLPYLKKKKKLDIEHIGNSVFVTLIYT